MTDETVKIEIKDEFELEYSMCSAAERDASGEPSEDEWWWKVTSTGNHEVIIASDEGFDSKSNADRNFKLVQRALLSL